MGNVLICDDERSICEMLEISLRKDGHRVETVTSGEAAKKKLESALFGVVITDIRMPQTNGIEVLRFAHTVSPDSLVILITAVDDLEPAVQAVKAGGAWDYIRKGPGLVDDVKLSVRKAMEQQNLQRQNIAFQRDAAGTQLTGKHRRSQRRRRSSETDNSQRCDYQQHSIDLW